MVCNGARMGRREGSNRTMKKEDRRVRVDEELRVNKADWTGRWRTDAMSKKELVEMVED